MKGQNFNDRLNVENVSEGPQQLLSILDGL